MGWWWKESLVFSLYAICSYCVYLETRLKSEMEGREKICNMHVCVHLMCLLSLPQCRVHRLSHVPTRITRFSQKVLTERSVCALTDNMYGSRSQEGENRIERCNGA